MTRPINAANRTARIGTKISISAWGLSLICTIVTMVVTSISFVSRVFLICVFVADVVSKALAFEFVDAVAMVRVVSVLNAKVGDCISLQSRSNIRMLGVAI